MVNIHLFVHEIAQQVSLDHHWNMQMYKGHKQTCPPNQLVSDVDLHNSNTS
jgi:hypothetical protein